MKIPYVINKQGKLAPKPAFTFNDGYVFTNFSWQASYAPSPGFSFLDGYV